MKGIHGALLNLLGAMGRMKVRGLPRALVIVLMLLDYRQHPFILGRLDLAMGSHGAGGPPGPEHAAPDSDRCVLHRSHRLHREKLGGR